MRKISTISNEFNLSLSEMRRIAKDFRSEMAKGLSNKDSSLKMIPTYVDRPTGDENGKFIALDLGGTNFRILELELKGKGVTGAPIVTNFVLKKRYLVGSAGDFFDFIASSIRKFIEKNRLRAEKELNLGFTFSFPVEQKGISDGVLLRWTKGFNVKGVIGNDVVKLLEKALTRNGISNLKVSAIVNDTVGTLAAGSYGDRDCDIGIIVGTGTNACYVEELSNIPKWQARQTPTGQMIVNIEWGNFNKLPLTRYDKELDRSSDRPGQQILEKMVSGMYLGELSRLILKDSGLRIFDKIKSFKTEYVSIVEGDKSRNLNKTESLLKKIGIKNSNIEDRKILKKICSSVSTRASRIVAASLSAIITKIDPSLSRNHTIAIDGSVYEKHPYFSENIKSAFKELFGERATNIKIALTKDGSGKGAAIIAAIAAPGRLQSTKS